SIVKQIKLNIDDCTDRVFVLNRTEFWYPGKLSGIWRENRTEFWYSANCPEYDEKSGQNFGIRETVRNMARKPDRILVFGKLSGICGENRTEFWYPANCPEYDGKSGQNFGIQKTVCIICHPPLISRSIVIVIKLNGFTWTNVMKLSYYRHNIYLVTW